ncbi:MAG: HEPN domain-containing protein [Actinomycetota bacterium]
MAKKSKTRATAPGAEKIFLIKAENFLKAAQEAIEKRNWDPAASAGIHAIINSCDAMSAKFLSYRHAGSDHFGVLDVVAQLPLADKDELKKIKRRVARSLDSKNDVEYDDYLVREGPAKQIVSDAEAILSWALKHIKP